MLDSVWSVLSGLLHLDFSVITENIVTLVLTLFAAALGLFAVYYLKRRRKTMDHQRMAAIVKGLHRAGVTRDVFKPAAPAQADTHDHLLSGMRWLFTGLGVSGALYTYGSVDPVAAESGEAFRGALIGVVPAAIGIAHLIFSFICRRRGRRQVAFPSRMAYRSVSRRY
jgi:hypothetical protein